MMKLFANICFAVLTLVGLVGCAVDDSPVSASEGTVDVRLSLTAGGWQTRVFTNDPATHSVDRILVIPFNKTGADTTAASYTPDMSQIVQYDVAAFEYEVSTKLLRGKTYKILVLGYNSADYDYYDRLSGSNKFELDYMATSLEDFALTIVPPDGVSPIASCEIFKGFATIADGSDYFVAGENNEIKCTLQRMVGGFSITLNDIPSDAEYVLLAANGLSYGAMLGGDESPISSTSDEDMLALLTPSEGTISFDIYLFSCAGASFQIQVGVSGFQLPVYTIVATNPATGETLDIFPIVANEAYNLSGSYNDFKFVIDIGPSVGLDDDEWDGYN